jgi:hypothetical protein
MTLLNSDRPIETAAKETGRTFGKVHPLLATIMLATTLAGCNQSKPGDSAAQEEPTEITTTLIEYASIPKAQDGYALYAEIPSEEGGYNDSYGPTGFAVSADGSIWVGNATPVLSQDLAPALYHFNTEGELLDSFEFPSDHFRLIESNYINVGYFYTEAGKIIALDMPSATEAYSSIVTLSEEERVEEDLILPAGFNDELVSYLRLAHDDRGVELVKESGTSFVHFSEEGVPAVRDYLEFDGNTYELNEGMELLINDVVVAEYTAPENSIGGFGFIGLTADGICIAEESFEMTNNEASSTVKCFSSAGNLVASVPVSLENNVVSYDIHYIVGEDRNVYTLNALEDTVEIGKIAL